jgi:hypothetical protein
MPSSTPPCQRVTPSGSFAVLILLALSGCVSYTPLLGDPPAPGQEVRLELTPEARFRMVGLLGRDIARLEGRMLGRSAAGDSLQVMVLGPQVGATRTQPARIPVNLHPSEIVGVDRKQLSKSRTALAATALTALAVTLYRSIVRGGGKFGGEEEGPAPPEEF